MNELNLTVELYKEEGLDNLVNEEYGCRLCIPGLKRWLEPEDVRDNMYLRIVDERAVLYGRVAPEDTFLITPGMQVDGEFWHTLKNGTREYAVLDVDFDSLGMHRDTHYYAWFEYDDYNAS